jgi:putative membrane protein
MKREIHLSRYLRHSLAIGTLLTCVAVYADHEKTAQDDQGQGHGDKATKFITEAAQGGQAEVKMGQLASQNGQSQDVKKLGETLVQDHQKANQELMSLAQKKNIQVPQDLGKHQHMVDRLQSKSGADFDKTFVTMAVKDHKKDIAKFEKCSKDVNDTELKAFIDKTLPTLRNHLQMAQSAARNLGISEATLSATDREDSDAAGAPGESQRGGDINKAQQNHSADRDYKSDNKSNSDTSSGSKGTRFQGSIDQPSGSSQDGAVQSDSSLTINKNTPSATDSSLNARTDASVSSSNPVITSAPSSSSATVSSDTGEQKTLGITTQKGDHKTLGLNTSKDDGKLLGFIPWRKHHKAEMDVNTSSSTSSSSDQNSSVGSPASNSSGQGSSSGRY